MTNHRPGYLLRTVTCFLIGLLKLTTLQNWLRIRLVVVVEKEVYKC